jgi:hypothetical protein
VSKPDDQTEADKISLDKIKARDIKPAQSDEVENCIKTISVLNALQNVIKILG